MAVVAAVNQFIEADRSKTDVGVRRSHLRLTALNKHPALTGIM